MSCNRLVAIFVFGWLVVASSDAGAATSTSSGWQPQSNNPTSSVSGLEQQLSHCLDVAKQGDVQKALQLAQAAKLSYHSQRMFDVSYINTLLSIVDQAQSSCDNQVINEAIDVVNGARNSSSYNGTGDAEVAYHFMKALGRLAELTMECNERVSAKIRIFEGQIAVNLKSNPSYPRNALEALAAPMVSMAHGYAIRDDRVKAFEALRKAVNAGYGEYHDVCDTQWVRQLADDETIDTLRDELDHTYQTAVDNWSKKVIAEFKPIRINFDVAAMDGDRIRTEDFGGNVLVVDLWATWCAPCRKGLPHYRELHQEMAGKGVTVLGISMDDPKNPMGAAGVVSDFAAEEKLEYALALGDESLSRQVPGKEALPTTLFFDRRGQVRYIARGYHDYAKIKAITKTLMAEHQSVAAGMPTLDF